MAASAAASPNHGLESAANPNPISVTASETRSGSSVKKISSNEGRESWSCRKESIRRQLMRSRQQIIPRVQNSSGLIGSRVPMKEKPARMPRIIPVMATISLETPRPVSRRDRIRPEINDQRMRR